MDSKPPSLPHVFTLTLNLLRLTVMILGTCLLNFSRTARGTKTVFLQAGAWSNKLFVIRYRTNTRGYQRPLRALTPSQQQTRQMRAMQPRIRPSPLECHTTTGPIAQDFSCDWDKCHGGSFIRTLPDFNRITRVEFIFHRLYNKPARVRHAVERGLPRLQGW
ncbi:hypothetical protein C8R46DRAFT_1098689 [Mycena filopes]|nr:hypothetical protein C8R46DRAFT_1098689 [Mycena filopes]